LPAWFATILHVPVVTPVTVDPEIVQMLVVIDVNVTVRPELAVALTVPVPPTDTAGAVPKVIVWLPLPTVMLWVTCGAAL
jgi:hypothetical protein